MFNYHNFDEVFSFDPECSYNEDAVRTTAEHRTALEGLFLDGVLKFLGMKRREYMLFPSHIRCTDSDQP